ncbi:uncharacterized protein LOC120326489 [Styela clava]
MHNFIVLALLLPMVVLEVSSRCCGRGRHGRCNDCAQVGLFKYRKCCGSGSGYGYGCNIFCCRCGSCRRGHPHFVKLYGFWASARYRCTKLYNSEENNNAEMDALKDTWETFNAIDQDGDSVINPDEFLDAIKSRLSNEEAHLLASDLLKSDDTDEIMSFIDAFNEREVMDADENVHNDILFTLAREFNEMDENGDGLIQAGEFDEDLK